MKLFDVESKREREIQTLALMIRIYCKKKHGAEPLCPDCAALFRYAAERSEKCPFMETKTFCATCKVHCYKPQMREQIRRVMKYAGPRMMLYHPILAVKHVADTIKNKSLLLF